MPSTTSFAPSSCNPAARSGLPTTAETCAPDCAAIPLHGQRPRSARCPGDQNTRRPTSAPPWRSVRSAVSPATGKVAAWAKETFFGIIAIRWLGTAAR